MFINFIKINEVGKFKYKPKIKIVSKKVVFSIKSILNQIMNFRETIEKVQKGEK